MPKDYAKRFGKLPEPPKKRGRIKFVAVVCLLLLIVSMGLYLYDSTLSGGTLLTDVKNYFIQKTNHSKRQTLQRNQALLEQSDQDSDVHFDFYNELPNRQVSVLDEDKKASENNLIRSNHVSGQNKPALSAGSISGYIVQLGIFKDPAEASQFRLSLLLLGYESDLFQITTGSQEMYRVQKGPFTSAMDAKRLQQKLKSKGIESELIKTS